MSEYNKSVKGAEMAPKYRALGRMAHMFTAVHLSRHHDGVLVYLSSDNTAVVFLVIGWSFLPSALAACSSCTGNWSYKNSQW